MNQVFELTKEQKDQAVAQIKDFFYEQRDEVIGDLAALLFLDFMCEKFGAFFYNLGIEDAVTLMRDKLEDVYSLEK